MVDENACFVTTQVDADACVAAAWIIGLKLDREKTIQEKRKLQAIAFDCDHLVVPQELNEYSEFATKAVAALKSNSDKLIQILNLPTNRKEWTKENKEFYASKAFEQGVIHLSKATLGYLLYPGEHGEANNYIEKLNENIKIWETSANILKYRDVLIFDCTRVEGYLDPRVTLRAAQNVGVIGEEPFTVTQRKIVKNNEFVGYSYTIGVVPLHKNIEQVDYVGKYVFEELTYAELRHSFNHFDNSIIAANLIDEWELLRETSEAEYWLCSPKVKLGWGGRKTVGGSSWNTPSKLSPQKVIDVILNCHNL